MPSKMILGKFSSMGAEPGPGSIPGWCSSDLRRYGGAGIDLSDLGGCWTFPLCSMGHYRSAATVKIRLVVFYGPVKGEMSDGSVWCAR